MLKKINEYTDLFKIVNALKKKNLKCKFCDNPAQYVVIDIDWFDITGRETATYIFPNKIKRRNYLLFFNKNR